MPGETSYWEEREKEWRKEDDLTEKEYRKKLEAVYKDMFQHCMDEINAFYSKYAQKEGISLKEAKKRVTKLDMEYFEHKAEYYCKLAQMDRDENTRKRELIYFSDQANEEMALYNLTMKINRLEMLKSLLDAALTSGFDQIHQVMEETMNTETYKQFERLAGILGPTVMDPSENVEAIVNGNFQGANFSQRLWGSNQTALKNTLYSELSRGMVQGLSPKDLAKKLEGKFTQSQYAAERLMRTELTNCRMQANKKSMEDNGFEMYIFLPMKTACPICLALKDNHYKLEDAEPGKNYPPMHPNCRCATAPYTDEKLYNEWLDTVRDHGLSFDEWKAERRTHPPLQQHKKGEKVLITEQAIEKVRNLPIKDYSPEANKFASKIRKELLRFARNENNSNEVACVIDFENEKVSDMAKGERTEVNIESNSSAWSMLTRAKDRSLELTHNHPGLSYFSLNDLNIFFSHSTVGTISIVTNKGLVWYLRKTEKFSSKKAALIMKQLIAEGYKGDELVERFLKKCYSMGIERN